MSQFQHSFQAGGASQFMVQVRVPSPQNIILSRSSLPQYFLCKTDFIKTILFLRRLEMRNITMWDSVRGRRRCAILFQLRSNLICIIVFWLIFTLSHVANCPKGGHLAQTQRRGRTLCARDGGGDGEGGGAGAQCGPEGVLNCLPGGLSLKLLTIFSGRSGFIVPDSYFSK